MWVPILIIAAIVFWIGFVGGYYMHLDQSIRAALLPVSVIFISFCAAGVAAVSIPADSSLITVGKLTETLIAAFVICTCCYVAGLVVGTAAHGSRTAGNR